MASTTFTQEDLVDLFSRKFTLAAQHPSLPTQQFTFPSDRSTDTIYASTHYTHSSYHTTPSSASQDSSIKQSIRAHDIQPSHLFPCQLELFRTASSDQRLRLLELWRTAPLRASDKDDIRERYGDLQTTNLLQEEVMAHLRYERNLAEQKAKAAQKQTPEAEPYMIAGYSERADDSKVNGRTGTGLWEAPRQEDSMEDQYGAFLAARDFERFQQLHAQVEAANAIDACVGMDDEMVA